MKLYCYIENEQIVNGPITLPVCWKNVSNFYLLDDESLKEFGWLPYIKVSDYKDVFVSSSIEIVNDKVIETIITRDKTPEELAEQNAQETLSKWQTVRNQRDELLKKSDIYVLIDRWNSMDTEQQQQWTEYRQLLRDIPQTYTDPDLVVFPPLPS